MRRTYVTMEVIYGRRWVCACYLAPHKRMDGAWVWTPTRLVHGRLRAALGFAGASWGEADTPAAARVFDQYDQEVRPFARLTPAELEEMRHG